MEQLKTVAWILAYGMSAYSLGYGISAYNLGKTDSTAGWWAFLIASVLVCGYIAAWRTMESYK